MIRYDAVPYLGLADDVFSLRDLSGEHIGPSITLAPADPGQDNTDLERNILYVTNSEMCTYCTPINGTTRLSNIPKGAEHRSGLRRCILVELYEVVV